MRLRRRVASWVCCIAALCAGSAAAADGPPCVETPATPGALPARLPGLRYDCVLLPSGQALQVGRAGPDDAPPLLLVHGLGQNAHRDWLNTLPELAARFQVLAVDLPGFGGSPPPQRAYSFDTLGSTLAELLAQLAPGRRVQVVGHSLGAAASLQLAHRHAAQVDRLVLVDAAGILLKPVFMHHVASLRLPQVGIAPVDRLLRLVDERVNSLSSLIFLGRDDRYDISPWLMRNPDVRQALFGGLVQADAALSLVEHDFTVAIRETQAPTTVLWGDDDRIAPLRTGELLAARLPQARLQRIAGAGHTPMQEQPAAFNRALLDALLGPPPQRAAAPAYGSSQGHVVCRETDGQVYSGRFESLALERCGSVQIHDAWIGRLTLANSSATLDNSVVDSPGVALSARNSELRATAVLLRGRVAVRAENSWLDIAGSSLRASGPVVEAPAGDSRLFLSVSDWQGSDQQGDAHFIWPRTGR